MSDPTSTLVPPHSLAILDDYASIGLPHFAHISPSALSVTTIPDTLPPSAHAEIVTRLRPFSILSTMRERTPLPASVLNKLPKLKLILTTGQRNASFDIPVCTERGIIVAGTAGAGRSDVIGSRSQNVKKEPEESSPKIESEKAEKQANPPSSSFSSNVDPTTQQTWSLILALASNISRGHQAIKSGLWQPKPLFTTSLAGKTLAILGLGRLGARTARIGATAFGMKIICWSANLTQEKADEIAIMQGGLGEGTFHVVPTKKELFRAADVLSVHYVLSERSAGIVGMSELQAMKPSAMFINTSRGKLVNETALLQVLKEGRIKGAALDVFCTEPLEEDSQWRTTRWGEEGRSEVLMSPHMGYVEEGLMHRWYEEQADNLERWIEGREVTTRLN